jgi:hypothetical protein
VRVDVSGANEGDPLKHEGTARHYLMLRLSLLRKPLGAVFAQFTETYRSAEEAQCAFADAVAAAAAGKGTPAAAAAKLAATMDGSAMLVETLASVVLLPLDTVLTALRHGLHGSDRCRDEGPTIVGGVTVDRALDSVGNLLRHRHEWVRRMAAGEPLQARQQTSITSLMRVVRRSPDVTDRDAYDDFPYVERPCADILDALSSFARDRNEASYESVHDRVVLAGQLTISNKFHPRAVAASGTIPVVEI